MKRTFLNPVPLFGLAAVTLLAIAFGFQFSGYLPCELCWWQRYPYFAIALVAGIVTLLGKQLETVALYAIAGLFALDAGIALFHVGVEQKWWNGLDSCSSAINVNAMSADELLEFMSKESVPACDQAAWELFGISMAGWNGVAALSLAILCVLIITRKRANRRFV